MADICAYLSAPGFEHELATELGADIVEEINGLFLAQPQSHPPAWAANIWYKPQRVPIGSIGEAANKLRAIQRNWALHPGNAFRRSKLIQDRLPKLPDKPFVFGAPIPQNPMGSWTLLDQNTLLLSPECSSPFPHGRLAFVEDRTNPPSRAYLKLREALTRAGQMPGPGDTCIDLGSCPGGWTWVLANLGCSVISVDKAPISPDVAALANVKELRESAFALDPAEFPTTTWVFSDIICYPDRLYKLVSRWQSVHTGARFICTLKFQGETDFTIIQKFKDLPKSQLIHLHHNKHELTWIRV